MNISIVDPGWDWTSFIIVTAILIPVLVMAIISTAMYKKTRKDSWEGWMFGLWLIFVFGSLIGYLVVVSGFGHDNYEAALSSEVKSALSAEGFTDVVVTEDRTQFTANRDGEYFHGVLVPTGDLSWDVRQAVPVSK